MKIRLAHFYPDLLNFYNDDGNVVILEQKAKQLGMDFEITNISVGDYFDPQAYDLLFIGGGKDSAQRVVSLDLISNKKTELIQAIESEIPMLCICGGYQLMGNRYLDASGHEIQGLGILDVETIAHQERLVGNLEFEVDLNLENKILKGIENHAGRTYFCAKLSSGINTKIKPFGRVIKGYGNNGEDGTEGAIYKNLIGTYAHGSFLPKNPEMADYLLKMSIERKKQHLYNEEDVNRKF